MKKKVYTSIATRLVIYIILVMIVLFTVVMVFTYKYIRKEIVDDALKNTQIEMRNTASQIGSKLSMVELAVVNAAWVIEENIDDHQYLRDILSSMVQNNPSIIGSSIAFEPNFYPEKGESFILRSYKKGDKTISTEGNETEGIDYSGMNCYIIPKLLKKSYWNDASFDKGHTDMVISTFTYPLYDDKGDVYAVLSAKVSLVQLTKWVKELAPVASSYTFLIDQHGYYLTHPRSERIADQSIFSVALETRDTIYYNIGKAMIAGESGTVSDQGTYANYTPIPNVGWSICNVCPEQIITAKVDDFFYTLLVYFLVALVVIVMVLYLFIKKLLRPLILFAESAKEIAVGDFNITLPKITSNDEMLTLYNSFEHMQVSLKKHIVELEETIAINHRVESELEIAHQKEESDRNLKLALEAGSVDAWSYDVKSKKFYPLGDSNSSEKGLIALDCDNTTIHPDDIERRDSIIEKIVNGDIDKAKTILRYEQNGSQDKYSYFETHMIAKKVNNIVVEIPFAHRDITAEYLLEEEQNNSRKKTEFAISSAELVLWEYDAINHEFTTYNNTAIGLGLSDNISIDNYCKYLNADDSSDIELRGMIGSMDERNDKSYSIDIRICPKSSDACQWMDCTIECSPFEKDEDGRVTKYVGFIKDHTKWSTLNDKLVGLNSQLQLVLDIGRIYPFVCDVKGDVFNFGATDDSRSISFVEPDTDLTSDQVFEIIHHEDRERIRSIIVSLISGDIAKMCEEIRYSTPDKHGLIYEMIASTVRDKEYEGQIELIGYVQDITEHNKLITELEEAKKEAEKSAKLKTAFLANMSHEIRTPLNAIIGFSELLADEEDEVSKAEFIRIIATNNNLLLKLINDVLDLSKIDAGFIDINIALFDFSQFFSELHTTMQMRLMGSDVKLSIINPFDRCVVELDQNRLSQICINYITNAIKYTPEGTICMSYEYINSGLRVCVKDTGIGIHDDQKGKVFQRFEKLDDFAQGTGLGLSITKALVESMNGKVGFESEKGVGSTFWAWIPCQPILDNDDIEK